MDFVPYPDDTLEEHEKWLKENPDFNLLECKRIKKVGDMVIHYTKLYNKLKLYYRQQNVDTDLKLRCLSQTIEYLKESIDKRLKSILPLE